jgi:tetratricopeptide (TPR) repeat protein
MKTPILETQRDVQNHLQRGKEAQAQGLLIDALTEFGQGWQKALTLPQKFNWLNEQKTERYSELMEKLLSELVNGVSLRAVSNETPTSGPEQSEGTITIVATLLPGDVPIKQLALTATYEGGGRLRSQGGQEGTSVNIVTGDNGQAEVYVQERGKEILKNSIRITLDKSSINALESLIGQSLIDALMAKTVTVVLSEPKKLRVAVLPFYNLRDDDTKMDWIAKSIQEALTNKLTEVKSIEVLARLDLPAILKELKLQMSGLIDESSATNIDIGRMLSATHIVTGTYTAIERHLKVSARLVDAEKGTVELKAAEVEGDVIKSQTELSATGFFALTRKLAFSLAVQLDQSLSEEDISSSLPSLPPTDSAFEIFKRALQLQNQGQIDEAIALYKDGLKLDPYRAEAYNNLGICYGKQKRTKEARESYEMALRLKPRFPEVYNNLGWLLLETGDVEGAIEQFQTGLTLAPKTLHIWTNLAWAYYIKGDYPKAIETNTAILKEYPKELYPRYNLALSYLCNGDIDAAEREYKEAYNQTYRPDEPAYQSAMDDLNLLKNGIHQREAERMLEILQWRK